MNDSGTVAGRLGIPYFLLERTITTNAGKKQQQQQQAQLNIR